jgi:hypothetical protein
MGSWRKNLGRVARLLALLICAIIFIPLLIALVRTAIECRMLGGEVTPSNAGTAPANLGGGTALIDDPGYARPEDQTYLTLPEWYIVYSADEYAAYVAERPPSGFPYFGAVQQFWQSYQGVCAVTRDRYAFNSGYHLTLMVIGVSFTVENMAKGIYENTVGRATEWLSDGEPTEEEIYAREVAAEYGRFIHNVPWFEFPFAERLGGLWSETPLWGPNMARKLERRATLSVEYGLKSGYGWLLKQGTASVYDTENLEIQAVVTGLTPELERGFPEIRRVRELDGGRALIALPRYEAFTQLVPRLAGAGLRFVEIAGNDEILITLIAPQQGENRLSAGEYLFALPILTDPERARVALRVPVAALHQVLGELDGETLVLEHIYDY